tara:strand:+ start:1513 stop:3036 length:1524 start_codon:yes stop_codon:yes gene_type:complete
MAQQLQSINLVAPAFKGVNTEDSPLAQDPSFAEIADNAVIDKRGRIASRKGHTVVTTNKTVLGTDSLRAIKEYEDNAGNSKIFSVGNNKIISGTTTLADETPGSYTISANDWKIVNFNDHMFFFQRGYEPLVYSNHVGSVEKMSTHPHASGVASTMYGHEVLAAYGRLWTADFSANKSTIYWSDLLDGTAWSGGSSGNIDVSKVWPDGYDEIVALAAHNGLLIIFGKHSIIVYEGATSPASMTLSDTIAGIGCVNRDTVQYTGTDVLFLSHTGLKSFGRTIQEKSMPISSLSGNITKDIISALQNETEFFRSVYSPEEGFYLLAFTGQNVIYCFDVRSILENGSYRVTRWVGTGFTSFTRLENGTVYVGTTNGISQYAGYQDNGLKYRFKYYSPSLTFGDASRAKILKKLKPTLVGANDATVFLKWAYDFDTTYSTAEFTVGTQISGYYGESEYTTVEFTAGQLTSQRSLNATGYGTSVVVGLEADINGTALSLQEINVMALIGKLL